MYSDRKDSFAVYSQTIVRSVSCSILFALVVFTLASCAKVHTDRGYNESCTETIIDEKAGHQALLGSIFKSLEDLKKTIDIRYLDENDERALSRPAVSVSHCSQGKRVVSILEAGVHEGDFRNAQDGDFWDKLDLVIASPWAINRREDLQAVYHLARRRPDLFGTGDVAFFDLALATTSHINKQDLRFVSEKDTGEKGYLNTFNHITAQAFVTSVFSEDMADFIADSHERYHMPELMTGEFEASQLSDPDKNPLDNYVDIVNNEWGQELGKRLKVKYQISRQTEWDPETLASYLNDLQLYYTAAFQVGFSPFRPDDVVVQKFSAKINRTLGGKV